MTIIVAVITIIPLFVWGVVDIVNHPSVVWTSSGTTSPAVMTPLTLGVGAVSVGVLYLLYRLVLYRLGRLIHRLAGYLGGELSKEEIQRRKERR